MNDIAIKVENLGKRYQIGARQEGYRTLRETLTGFFTHPFRRRRHAAQGSHRSKGEDFWALKDISLEIKRGEVVGIIGRNGAGKTTLLKILSRITEPTVGRAEIYGRVGSLLEVGTGFHPELTGRENIYLNGAILGMRKAEIDRKFDDIVAFAEVDKFLDTPVKRYSSGMYIRLAFAVAANLEPDILLVDEVLAVGDAAFQKKCLGKMSEVSQEGRTVLFVSHNIAAIRTLCQKGILLENGSLIDFDEIDPVLANYQRDCFETVSDGSTHNYKRPLKHTGRVLLSDCKVTIPYYWKDAIVFSFTYDIKEPVDHFTVDWFLKDIYGTRIMSGFSALSEDCYFVPQDIMGGDIKCTVNEWRLPGGRYSLTVQITNPLIELMDYVEDALIFDIPKMFPGIRPFCFTPHFGNIIPETIWDCDSNTTMLQFDNLGLLNE